MDPQASIPTLVGSVIWTLIGAGLAWARPAPDGLMAGFVMVATGLMVGISEYRGKSF